VASYTNELLTQTFYDDYSWSALQRPVSATMATGVTSATFITSYNASPIYAVNHCPLCCEGMMTGSKKEVLGSSGAIPLYASFMMTGKDNQTQETNYTEC